MDFSFLKELAEQTNQKELSRQEKLRRDLEEKRQKALATVPFMEKVYTLLNACSEEFNTLCHFPHLRVQMSKLYKRQRSGDSIETEPDEVAYFTFNRVGYLFGIRGMNGAIEFVEIPITETTTSITLKLDELGVSPSRRWEARIDQTTKGIAWYEDFQALDGARIQSECLAYFGRFLEQTNAEIK